VKVEVARKSEVDLKFAISCARTIKFWTEHPCHWQMPRLLENFPFTLRDRYLSGIDNLTRAPSKMAHLHSFLRTVCSLLLLLACGEALKFDIEAASRGDPKGTRCIRNFVAKDTLVVVTATVDGYKGDGMVVNMHVSHDP